MSILDLLTKVSDMATKHQHDAFVEAGKKAFTACRANAVKLANDLFAVRQKVIVMAPQVQAEKNALDANLKAIDAKKDEVAFWMAKDDISAAFAEIEDLYVRDALAYAKHLALYEQMLANIEHCAGTTIIRTHYSKEITYREAPLPKWCYNRDGKTYQVAYGPHPVDTLPFVQTAYAQCRAFVHSQEEIERRAWQKTRYENLVTAVPDFTSSMTGTTAHFSICEEVEDLILAQMIAEEERTQNHVAFANQVISLMNHVAFANQVISLIGPGTLAMHVQDEIVAKRQAVRDWQAQLIRDLHRATKGSKIRHIGDDLIATGYDEPTVERWVAMLINRRKPAAKVVIQHVDETPKVVAESHIESLDDLAVLSAKNVATATAVLKEVEVEVLEDYSDVPYYAADVRAVRRMQRNKDKAISAKSRNQ